MRKPQETSWLRIKLGYDNDFTVRCFEESPVLSGWSGLRQCEKSDTDKRFD